MAEQGMDNCGRRVCKVEYIPTHEPFLLADGGLIELPGGNTQRQALYGDYVPKDPALYQKVKEIAREYFDTSKP